MQRFSVCAALLLILLAPARCAMGKDLDGPRDQFGNVFRLSSHESDRLIVVAFLGVECPLGPLYINRLNELVERYHAQGVHFVAVNSNQHDTYEAMCEFAKACRFAVLKDLGNKVADDFGATRSPEVFLLNANRDVIYQGRIDDQYAPGIHTKSAPTRNDLEMAIQESLNSQPISVPTTVAAGCHIDRVRRPAQSDSVTYAKYIAAIFDAHCVECHRPGEAAPFPLQTYSDAAAWRDTIREVLEQKRMPPWSAEPNPEGIHYANDRSLSDKERKLIFAWLDAGAPEGNPADRPVPPAFTKGWTIRPDVVLTMPKPFVVPKEGVLEYQEFPIDPGFFQDTWVKAIEIRPGNRAVVHHATIYLKPKNAAPGHFFFDGHQSQHLAMYVPGNTSTTMLEGTGKRIPAGWDLVLSIHYVPNGVEQVDQSSIGLTLCEPPPIEIATRVAVNTELVLQPGEVKQAVCELKLDEQALLTALYPHMHLRGRSMRFQAFYPNGSVQTLLNVPDYDFEWQHRYQLATPLIMPAGTVLRCTAVYDNSAANKRNPDPNAVVPAGILTTEEMMLGVFDLGYLRPRKKPSTALPLLAVALAGVFVISRRLNPTRDATRD